MTAPRWRACGRAWRAPRRPFVTRWRARKSRGELPLAADVDALARFLTAGFQGLRLVGKANPDRAMLEDVARTMLRCLD